MNGDSIQSGEVGMAAVDGRRRRRAVRVAAAVRWLHIYMSMFGLAAVLFFSVTGLTLNHPDWFFGEAETTEGFEGRLDPDWVRPGIEAARLEVVEHLRGEHGVGGALAEFREDDSECLVTFKGPGYAADAFIDRESGEYELTQTRHGPIAVLNDLHKGRDTGPAWSLVIDISAVLLTFSSLSGLVLLLYLKLRRRPGTLVAIIGGVIILAIAIFGVP